MQFKPGDIITYKHEETGRCSIGIVCDQATINEQGCCDTGPSRVWAFWDGLLYPKHADIKDCTLVEPKLRRKLPDWF